MNRKNKLVPSVTALYCRLSIEDGRENESMSISNQDGICQGYFHPKDERPPKAQTAQSVPSFSSTTRGVQFPKRFGGTGVNANQYLQICYSDKVLQKHYRHSHWCENNLSTFPRSGTATPESSLWSDQFRLICGCLGREKASAGELLSLLPGNTMRYKPNQFCCGTTTMLQMTSPASLRSVYSCVVS